MHTAFTYKKCDLQHQDEANDIAILGPSPTYSQSPLLDPSTTISTIFTLSTLSSKTATSRYISVGSYPMFTYYTTIESTRSLMSVTSMTSYVVSRVAFPVVSFAKSWWGSSTSQKSQKILLHPMFPTCTTLLDISNPPHPSRQSFPPTTLTAKPTKCRSALPLHQHSATHLLLQLTPSVVLPSGTPCKGK